MRLTNFDSFRIESDSFADAVFMDVDKFPEGCSSGFMVRAYEIPSSPKSYASHRIEVRRKERQIVMLVYKYSNAEIPDYWKDAEILYSWEQP